MSKSFAKQLFIWFAGNVTGRDKRPLRPRTVLMEALECRRLMAGLPTTRGMDYSDLSKTQQTVHAVGSITYSPTTRAISVEGADAYNDRVVISFDTRGTSSTADDVIEIQLANIGSPLRNQFPVSNVDRIFVRVYGGNDTIDNQCGVLMTAYGGKGMDVLLGGSDGDSLLGGDDADFIDGRLGNDMIWGEAGVDALFGDDGDDLILGGSEDDFLFGGNGDDSLYGEAGNDRLYGETGADRLTDSTGNNTLYSDYGPSITVSASGFLGFDWFDGKLKNPVVRSQARLDFRNGLLERTEVLNIYNIVAADNFVSSNEFADLKVLASTTALNSSADVQYFMNKVVYGDRANLRYHDAPLGNLAANSSGYQLIALVDKWFKGGGLPKIMANTHYQYVYGNLFVDGPQYSDIDQGETPDCYFLSALGETAFRSPSTIQRMFADNGDGTFLVQFFRDGSPQFVTVNRLLPASGRDKPIFAGWGTDSGFINDAQDPDNELWVALAEKAYVQLNESGWIGQDGKNDYQGIGFGFESIAFAHITGRAGERYDLSNSGIISAFNAGKAITIATKTSGVSSDIVPQHSYMLVGYDSMTKRFHLVNPHGLSSRPTDLFLTWSDLTANFTGTTSVML